MPWLDAVLLALGAVVSLTLSSTTGGGIGAVSRARALQITPRDAAFSIWAVIYPLLFAAAAFAYAAPVSRAWAVALSLAEVLTGAWAPLFVVNARASLIGAAVVLVFAAGASAAAVVAAGPLPRTDGLRAVCVHGATALFAGWVLCAAFLSIGIAIEASTDARVPPTALLALALVAAALAVAARNPVYALPCAWALLMQPRVQGPALVGVAICATAVAASAIRIS